MLVIKWLNKKVTLVGSPLESGYISVVGRISTRIWLNCRQLLFVFNILTCLSHLSYCWEVERQRLKNLIQLQKMSNILFLFNLCEFIIFIHRNIQQHNSNIHTYAVQVFRFFKKGTTLKIHCDRIYGIA